MKKLNLWGIIAVLLITVNCYAKNEYSLPKVDTIIDQALYLDENEKRRLEAWSTEGLWKLYQQLKEVDPGEEYYRTHYAHLLYLNQVYEDRRGLENCIHAATNVIIRGGDNPLLKRDHVFRIWPEEKQVFLRGVRQQEVFYAYWDLVNYYLGLNEYQKSDEVIAQFRDSGNRMYRFQADGLKYWQDFSRCESPDDFRVLLQEVRSYASKVRWDSSPIYDDWWYKRQKYVIYYMFRNIEGGILAELLESQAAIAHYRSILRDLEELKRRENYDLFDNAYVENLALCYFENFDFDKVEELFNLYIGQESFQNYNYSLASRYLNVLMSRNDITRSTDIMNRITDRDKQGSLAIAKGYLAYLSGNFEKALENLRYASRYQQTFMFTTYDRYSHYYLIYSMLMAIHHDYNHYLQFKKGWKFRLRFAGNTLSGNYYKLLAVDNFQRVKDYLNEYSYPPTLPVVTEIVRDLDPQSLNDKLDKYVREVDRRTKAQKYYSLVRAYRYLDSREAAKAEQYLGTEYDKANTDDKEEKIYLGMYYNAQCELAKLHRNKAEYRTNVIRLYRSFPQFVVLKGQRPVFRFGGVELTGSLKDNISPDPGEKRRVQRMTRALEKEIKTWQCDYLPVSAGEDIPLLQVSLSRMSSTNTNRMETGYVVEVKTGLGQDTIEEREFKLEEKNGAVSEETRDKLFNTVFHFNEDYDD